MNQKLSSWQVDFYRLPQQSNGESQWELVICDEIDRSVKTKSCRQAEASVHWLTASLQELAIDNLPSKIRVFRPEAVPLLQLAADQLGITLEKTRRTNFLKSVLIDRSGPKRVKIDSPPPQPLPENRWGEQWQFASLNAEEIEYRMPERPIPFREMPTELRPLQLNLGSTTLIPGLIIYGGRQSWQLAQWFSLTQPYAINYIPTVVGESGGLVLEGGLQDRWIIITFEDHEVAQAAQKYEQRKQDSKGLHFLLIQPDDSGMTDTGFWLLHNDT